ncbi:hypothetical protein GXN76_02710 [Kroppenstedtia pulmonis]|uniref:UDP-glucose/GDP-mannose dehydrogenase N-terminal domain-containing protein n=1 Tax=Kroppenstedtia pulmonis TaxID=1380685 RepID=A0A7D3XP12_9BACL|nr:hypothetical protein [Kroppenstedtia pulmonis]QKG83487.1 hypothetical protein GXN76_02710 [Kroppenstedtia pulmonis]
MKIAVLGNGAAALITGVCLAWLGYPTHCAQLPVPSNFRGWEPGLSRMLLRVIHEGSIHFYSETSAAIQQTDLLFWVMDTTTTDMPEDTQMCYTTEWITQHSPTCSTLVLFGDIPFGLTKTLQDHFQTLSRDVDVIHQVRTLKPGSGLQDFLQPEQIILGTFSRRSRHKMTYLYRHMASPLHFITPDQSEQVQFHFRHFQNLPALPPVSSLTSLHSSSSTLSNYQTSF